MLSTSALTSEFLSLGVAFMLSRFFPVPRQIRLPSLGRMKSMMSDSVVCLLDIFFGVGDDVVFDSLASE